MEPPRGKIDPTFVSMIEAKSIWLNRTRITGLILCTLLVAAYWTFFFYKIAANFQDFYCSMIHYTFLGWFRYVLLGLEPLLASTTVVLLLIPKANLSLGGIFLSKSEPDTRYLTTWL